MSAPERTRIKICGITRVEDAEVVVDAGADALGLNFSDRSARRVHPAVAAAIARRVTGQVLRVGVFSDPEAEDVRQILAEVDLDLLQFHGSESAEFCAAFHKPYLKAHRVAAAVDIAALNATFPDACAHLLDAYVAGQPGGTGIRFDWDFWPAAVTGPDATKLVLAGGLAADNVAVAVSSLRPYAVDVAGGVEADEKGRKDASKIRDFVAAVRQADRQTQADGD